MRAQSARSRRLGRACCGLAIVAGLATSACAAGDRAQTAEQKPTLDGTEASVGDMDLRNVAILAPSAPSYAPGASPRLRVVLVNNGQSTDRLTSITSSSITSWGSFATAAAAASALAPTPTTTPTTAAPSSSTSSIPSGSSSTNSSSKTSSSKTSSSSSVPTSSTPTSASSTVARPQPSRSIAIDPGGAASFEVPDSSRVIVLQGLKSRLYAGTSLRLTFTFARAGRVSFVVPVAQTSTPFDSVVPEPSGAGASATG